MSTLHNRGPPAALPGAWNYINPLTAENKATDQRVSPIRSERVSPIPPVAQLPNEATGERGVQEVPRELHEMNHSARINLARAVERR